MGLHLNGVGALHHMVHHNIPVIGIDSRRHQVGFWSRYGQKILCPNPEREQKQLLDFMLDLGRSTNWRGVLFPTNDEFALFVSTFREELQKYFEFSLPAQEIFEDLGNKWKFSLLAQQYGIARPQTFCPRSVEELSSLQHSLQFPCLLKPILTSLWKGTGNGKVFVASSFTELVDAYSRLSLGGGDLVVQELIPGGDDQAYLYFAYYDRRCRPLTECTIRKIRQYPPRFGTACLSESVWMPELVELSRALLEGIGYRGLVDVEFKRDKRDGEFKIIEINPRMGLQHPLASRAGSDLILTAYQDLTGQCPGSPIRAGIQEGVKWMILDRDLESAHHYLKCGELTIDEWLASVRGERTYALWSWRDPVPFLRSIRLKTWISAFGIFRILSRSITNRVLA